MKYIQAFFAVNAMAAFPLIPISCVMQFPALTLYSFATFVICGFGVAAFNTDN